MTQGLVIQLLLLHLDDLSFVLSEYLLNLILILLFVLIGFVVTGIIYHPSWLSWLAEVCMEPFHWHAAHCSLW